MVTESLLPYLVVTTFVAIIIIIIKKTEQKQLQWVMYSIDAVQAHALDMLRHLHVYLFYACPQNMKGTLRGLKAPFILQGT